MQHMKNYEKLLKKISSWLTPEGLLFIHIFVHKSMPYHFEVCTQDVASTVIFLLSHHPYMIHYYEHILENQRLHVSPCKLGNQ